MSTLLGSLLAFIVAIGVLVTVHEFGHFWVAKRLGVKVLRFSIGFGRPLWSTRFGRDNTELVVAALPLGGYVKMLDEREGEVAQTERTRAFNNQPVGSRIAIVVAGPLFNFLFAIFFYWMMFASGVPGLRPVVGDVLPGTLADEAGLLAGDEILMVQGEETPTWEATVLALLDAGLDSRDSVALVVRGENGARRDLTAHFRTGDELLEKGSVLENFGLEVWRPPAVIERLVPGGAGDRAGLQAGDRVLRVDGLAVTHWGQWVDYVRDRPEQAISVDVLREGEEVRLRVVPERVRDGAAEIGRIGAHVQLPSAEQRATMRVVVRHGLLGAVPAALEKTLEITTLTLKTLWKMVTGRASVENLSGPVSIAMYAGQSAGAGFATFLGFLGIVSVSLGVLNLLPIPVLDGGHLMYYLVELFKGSPVSEAVQLAGQKVGIVLLMALMSLAVFNDLVRLLNQY